LKSTWSGPVSATYVVKPIPLVVSEIHFHPDDGGAPGDADNLEFVELWNRGDSPVSLAGMRLRGGIDFKWSLTNAPTLAPGAYGVLVRNLAQFSVANLTVTNLIGEYGSDQLANDGERLALSGPLDEPVFDFRYEDSWEPLADGGGYSLVLANPRAPGDPALASSWKRSAQLGGSPGVPDPDGAVPPVPPMVSGRIEYYGNASDGIHGVVISMVGDVSRKSLSAPDGRYLVEGGANGAVTLTPSLATDVPIANGVTTADITLIRRHVLGLTLLDSPYKVMAGDVNGSDSVTTADITLIRRLILGTATTFSGGLWRFVPSDEAFTNTSKPWTATRMRQYASLASGTLSGQDFKAIKLGDVNGSWKAPTVTTGSILKSRAKGRLTVGKVTAATGEVVGIPIKAEGFAAVTSMQFTMRWDPAQLEFVSAGNFELPGLTAGNFNSLKMKEGLLTFSWDPPSGQGVELTTISELFQVQMKVLAAGGANAEMAWSESPTPTEVTVDFSPVETDKVIGGVTVSGGTSVTPESLVLTLKRISMDGWVELEVRAPVGGTILLESSDSLVLWMEDQRVIGQGADQPILIGLKMNPASPFKFLRARLRQ
jgi:hypothetical protein